MSGLGFVSSYGALMYQYLGIGAQRSFLLQIGAQILSMSGATVAFLVSDLYGRRPMYLFGCTALGVLLFCMGIAGSINTTAGVNAAVGFYTMYNFLFNVGVGSGVYAIAAEMPTSTLRSKSIAMSMILSNATTTMWAFVCPYIFNPGYGDLKAKIGFIFGGLMFIWAVMGYLWVPGLAEGRMRNWMSCS